MYGNSMAVLYIGSIHCLKEGFRSTALTELSRCEDKDSGPFVNIEEHEEELEQNEILVDDVVED